MVNAINMPVRRDWLLFYLYASLLMLMCIQMLIQMPLFGGANFANIVTVIKHDPPIAIRLQPPR